MGAADLDHRTDLYAIGCILFHVLTGRPPFVSDQGTGMMIAAHIRDPAPHPRTLDPKIPDSLAAIVLRLLQKEPAARYQSALEVREALVAAGASAPSRPPVGFDQYAATIAPMASSIGTAPTTASGSAAQVMTAQSTVAPTRSKTGLVLGIAAIAAAGLGVGVWAAMRGDAQPAQTAGLVSEPSGKPADEPATKPAELPVTASGRPVEQTAHVVAAEQTPCPLGKVRGFDTHGQCCWPEQAFSTAKSRCVGTPACPDGHKASGEDCAVVVAASTRGTETRVGEAKAPTQDVKPGSPPQPTPQPTPQPQPTPSQPKHASPAPTFKLDQKSYAPRDAIVITFASPVSSTTTNRAWITIVEATKPPSQYGTWSYIDDGTTTAKLSAPSHQGAYEVRLHTDYPAQSTNVRQSVPVTIGAAKAAASPRNERFMLATKVARVGDAVEITFPGPMKAADGERYWITLVKKDAADSAYGTYAYVTDGARSMQFEMPKHAGEYELRMHANYPRLSTNLVHRAPIRVED
jgi:hypothetical protein